MKINSFIKIVILTYIFIPFYANAFDLGDFSKKLLESAKNTQKTKSQSGTSSSPTTTSKANLPKFNIRGLYLSMPMKEAVVTIKNYSPPMTITPLNGDIGQVKGSQIRGLRYPLGFTAQVPRQTEIFSIAASTPLPPPENTETVMAIARLNNMKQSLLISDMKDLFVKKYGPPILESQPDSTGKLFSYMLSWSLKPNGKPQDSQAVVETCAPRGRGTTQSQMGVVNNIMLRANDYQQCGFTFVVRMVPSNVNYSNNTSTNAYVTILYDGNKARKIFNKTLAYTKELAKQLEKDRMKKLKGATKPQL